MANTINLNEASREEIAAISGIGPERALALIELRQRKGGLKSWEDLHKARGFSDALVQKLRESATLEATDGLSMIEGKESEPMLDRGVGVESDAEQTADDPELDAIAAIAQLDLEAARAYELAAGYVTQAALREPLLSFAADHRRHVEELEQYVTQQGGELLSSFEQAEDSVFVNLASSIGSLGNHEAIANLIGNEQFTNYIYMTALELVSDEQGRMLIDRNLGDEQRHLAWLSEQRTRLGELEAVSSARDDVTTGEPAPPA